MDSRRSIGTIACAIAALSMVASLAWGQNSPTPDCFATDARGNSSPLLSEAAVDQPPGAASDASFGQSCRGPRWTASADFIILERVGTVNQTLVTTYPVTPPPPPVNPPFIPGTGTERLNSEDLHQGFAPGLRVGLTYHGEEGCDVEFSFFQIDGWSSAGSVAPNGQSPSFAAPGGFIQTTDTATQAMGWEYATKLYNAELNARWTLCPRVTMLAGFRWVDLSEDLQGILTPPTQNRKGPFWITETRNNFYGFQIGEDCKIMERGRFSLDGLVKAGMFDNNADETTGVSIYRRMHWEDATTDQLAFLGEIDLQAKYQITQRLVLKAGYEAVWLQGVALAPGQISKTFCNGDPHDTYVAALGVDSGSHVFFHGAIVGLEYSF